MYHNPPSSHLDQRRLLRNYASGKLRQELDDEIEELVQHAEGLSGRERSVNESPRAWTFCVTELAKAARMTQEVLNYG